MNWYNKSKSCERMHKSSGPDGLFDVHYYVERLFRLMSKGWTLYSIPTSAGKSWYLKQEDGVNNDLGVRSDVCNWLERMKKIEVVPENNSGKSIKYKAVEGVQLSRQI